VLIYLQGQSRSQFNFSVQSEDSVLRILHLYMTYTGLRARGLAQLWDVQSFALRKILRRKSEIERRCPVDLGQNIE
jgi:hypothetical protein